MSVPARELPPRVPPPRNPSVRDLPAREPRGASPARHAPVERVRSAPGQAAGRRSRARSARRFHPAFWTLTSVIVTTIVVALVSVSALVVETGFGIDRTEARIAHLLDEGERLRSEVATMSAPGRVAGWARDRGLVMPEDVIVLQVRDQATAASTDGTGGTGG